MSTPTLTLSFKTENSSYLMTERTCFNWPGSITLAYRAPANNVLVGNNASPYLFDTNYVINADRKECNDLLWGNISSFFSRNITDPSVRNAIPGIAGIQVGNQTRVNTFSAGDSNIANIKTKNIFDPLLNGGKFYSISGISIKSLNTATVNKCVINSCQPRRIEYTLRNIFNPRDFITQNVGFIGEPTGSNLLPSAVVSSPNPADFLTELTWNCSPPNVEAGQFGLGTVTEFKGKTIEMKGITSTNVRTINRDPLVKVIYDQKCLRWSMTQYEYVQGRGFEKSTTLRVDVELVEKIRPSSEILYSDYFEGTETNKIVRYFEAINMETNRVITELYAIIDISVTPPLVYMCSNWRGERDDLNPNYKFIQNGFDPFNNESFVASISGVIVEPARGAFIPDMPLKWGVIPNRNMLLSQYGDSSRPIEISNFTKLVSNEFAADYFILCGEKPQTVGGITTSKRTLNLFSPNCANISLSICSNTQDCLPYGLNICENTRCVVCSRTNVAACRSTEQCIENKCTTRPACVSGSDECPQDQIFRFCNREKKVCVECNSTEDCEDGEICDVLSNSCQPPPTSCTSDTDCISGKECKDRFCANIPAQGFCTSNRDCASGKECKDNFCEDIPNFCTSNTDCFSGKECKNSFCVNIPSFCTSNTDCVSGKECKNSFCVNIPNFCTYNTDCVSGKECKNSFCVDIPPPPPPPPPPSSSTSRIGLVVGVSVGVLLLIYIFIKFRRLRRR